MGDTALQLFGIELGGGEGGRDDEEYQSFCLLSEVICGLTRICNNESSVVHH